LLFLLEQLLLPHLGVRFLLGGGGCDTSSVTIAATYFGTLNEILACFVCIINVVRFEFQI
jgi:hypothetical protein